MKLRWGLSIRHPGTGAVSERLGPGLIDELVIAGWLHVEQMSKREWWIRVGELTFWASGREVRPEQVVEPPPSVLKVAAGPRGWRVLAVDRGERVEWEDDGELVAAWIEPWLAVRTVESGGWEVRVGATNLLVQSAPAGATAGT